MEDSRFAGVVSLGYFGRWCGIEFQRQPDLACTSLRSFRRSATFAKEG
jgi:hypothetical protein